MESDSNSINLQPTSLRKQNTNKINVHTYTTKLIREQEKHTRLHA